ncbi:MAG: ATP-binding protein, partial [Roseburia sp.]|nr:ATP-binding protein [Roseburia sp.]
QEDIRDIQMAKAAIHAGVQILLKTCGIHPADVDKVYLAGGMGYYLNPEDAIAIGLLPKEFEGKIQAIGNSSLDGAERYLENPKEAGVKMEQIADMAEEVVLAEHPLFQTLYMDGMNFPVK